MRRRDDYNLTEFDAICLENGQFPEELSWPSCTNGEDNNINLRHGSNDNNNDDNNEDNNINLRRHGSNDKGTLFSETQCVEPMDLEQSDNIETLWTEGETINYKTIIK